MRLTRTYRFSSSHRLHTPRLSEEQNQELYGKCNNPYGHGHDYVLRVTVSGETDASTGRVIAPGRLDSWVRQHVIEVFDHKDMNRDVPEFHSVPTTENLAVDIAERLQAGWAGAFPGVELDSVAIRETPRNTFELRIG